LMRTLFLGTLCMLLTAARCDRKPANVHVAAATELTRMYAASRFVNWHLRAAAAGTNCDVLVVQAAIIVDESQIEALHYGAGTYDSYKGGVLQFTRDHAFRGVAYKDVSGRIWTYPPLSPREAEGLVPCR
jgi:hypothetical protein